MSELEVRIVRLEPLRVASFHALSATPEDEAWNKLAAFAKPRGLTDLKQHRIFGFNNPSPSPGSPNYGYEFCMTVGPEVMPEGEVEVKDFPGGLYAVARCQVRGEPYNAIPATWQQLVLWREASRYKSASHQWLEERIAVDDTLDGEWDLDLYLPIGE